MSCDGAAPSLKPGAFVAVRASWRDVQTNHGYARIQRRCLRWLLGGPTAHAAMGWDGQKFTDEATWLLWMDVPDRRQMARRGNTRRGGLDQMQELLPGTGTQCPCAPCSGRSC